MLCRIPITKVRGVGEKTASLLRNLNIFDVEDLFSHFPREYDDRSFSRAIEEAEPGARQTFIGRIVRASDFRPRRNMCITKAILEDDTGRITLVFFNQPYLKNTFRKDVWYRVTGRVTESFGETKIETPDMEVFEDFSAAEEAAGLVPYYSLTKGLSQKALRKMMAEAFAAFKDGINDILPPEMLEKYSLISRKKALFQIHFPTSMAEVREARRALVFEELVRFQLGIVKLKNDMDRDIQGIVLSDRGTQNAYEKTLPFSLTEGQKRSLDEIFADMTGGGRMNRLLQGDVGSGKTAVAAGALLLAVNNGYQAILMAPTEILARQHLKTLETFLAPLGVECALLVGSMKESEKKAVREKLKTHAVHVAVGTHALIQDSVEMADLGLVVTDEQHRFGVFQRYLLSSKGKEPHVLVMSATPIPRTLALTLYGDLDISIIDTMPKGRKPIDTRLLPARQNPTAMALVEEEVKQGRQAYFVAPLIEESEAMEQVMSAEELFEKTKKRFPDFRVALLHGRMKGPEKDAVMARFAGGEIDILVSTTVIEVGIDVKNATCMVIYHAERFGLSQLHQLRGRVGRGEHQSYCVLIEGSGKKDSMDRLMDLTRTEDGMEIAKLDLMRRGPGEFMGRRQHGVMEFKSADLMTDEKELEVTREAVLNLLQKDPDLLLPEHTALRESLGHHREPFGRDMMN